LKVGVMRALETTQAEPIGLRFCRRADPVALQHTVVIDVECFSLNSGEVRRVRTRQFEEGTVPGWDCVGVVTAIGSGADPSLYGKRVAAKLSIGSWAERCVAHELDLAIVPPGVSSSAAATIPIAGATALAALGQFGSLVGRTVLITGATGSVGRFAIQLAKAAGATVNALVDRDTASAELAELGADRVLSGLDEIAEVDFVIEMLGGPTLVRCSEVLASNGLLLSIGWSSRLPAVFPGNSLFGRSGCSMQSFTLGEHHAGGLIRKLLDLLASGCLRSEVRSESSWSSFGETIRVVTQRGFNGKAILHVDRDSPI
jgi:NADPH:quinone reductase